MASDQIPASWTTRLALGRAGHLGDLYNARTDMITSSILKTAEPPTKAIQTQSSSSAEHQVTTRDTLAEKFSTLGVDADLRASFLSGMLTLRASGKYLHRGKTSTHVQQASAICSTKTGTEALILESDELRDHLNLNVLAVAQATHVIRRIEWGARSIVTVTTTRSDLDTRTEFGGTLGIRPLDVEEGEDGSSQRDTSVLARLVQSIGHAHTTATIGSDSSLKEPATLFKFSVYADVCPQDGLPTDYEGVLEFVQKGQTAVKDMNGGKGVPIVFHLQPIHEVAETFKLPLKQKAVLERMDEVCLQTFVDHFDDLDILNQKLSDYIDQVTCYTFCLPEDHVKKAKQKLKSAKIFKAQLERKLHDKLTYVREGSEDMSALLELTESTAETGVTR